MGSFVEEPSIYMFIVNLGEALALANLLQSCMEVGSATWLTRVMLESKVSGPSDSMLP